MNETQQATATSSDKATALKIWRLVDKDGKPAPATKFPIIETLFGSARKTPAQPLDLKEKIKAADIENPKGAPHRYQAFVEEKVVTDLQRAVDHWKSNHAEQVQRSRVLLERPDLPLERVRAYATIGRLQEENSKLRQSAEQ